MLVEQARNGDQLALDGVVRGIQDRIYNLALRMLWLPADAEDATQEILIKIITHLGSFWGDSAFTTWAYRIASNHLLTTRRRRAEQVELTFERFGEQLDRGLADEATELEADTAHGLLVEEIKIGCTHGMLLCLDRPHRLAFILGEIVEVTGEQGAAILDTTPAAFRKRLSRARARLGAFMQGKCGLVNPANPCRCARRVDHATATGIVNPAELLFVERSLAVEPDVTMGERVQELEQLESVAALYRRHPRYAAPEAFVDGIKRLINAGTFGVLS
jgi:RNA polymerase sigma factor (sigma-70 family)